VLCVECWSRSTLPDSLLCAECHAKLKTVLQAMFYRRARKVYDMLDGWKSAKDVAFGLRCSTRGARNILKFLVEKGLVEEKWVRQHVIKGRWVKVYRRASREEHLRCRRR